jgi:thymidylate synthase (FAD)
MKVELLKCADDDLDVVNAARVSFGKQKQALDSADIRLIKYLATHNHILPFAHPQLRFRIIAPIFVARQLAKHQVGGVWSEESRRYVTTDPEMFRPKKFRRAAENVKQGSGPNLDSVEDGKAQRIYEDAMFACVDAYYALLDQGVAPEMARMLLPVASMTTWVWTGSLLLFSRVCKLRQAEDSQPETQEIANQIYTFCRDKFPFSWPALMEA